MHYPQLYVRFLYHFNLDRDYYECHEVMEELWLEEGRNLLYQGLLQIAVGLYHFQNDNVAGAMKLLEAGLDKLSDYPDQMMGIHLKKTKNDAEEYLSKLHRYEESPISFYDLTIQIVDPELQSKVERIKNAN